MKPFDVFAMVIFTIIAVAGGIVARGKMLGGLILETAGIEVTQDNLEAARRGGGFVVVVALLIVISICATKKPVGKTPNP